MNAEAISYIEECRDIHLRILRKIERGMYSTQKIRHVGNAAHHRKWVARYDVVLRALRGA